jgi:transcriptional regulator with XRE-family HTH domain
MKTTEAQVAGSLCSARMQAQLSLRQLAARAGTSHATLIAYEKGRKVPSTSTYFRILEACGNTVEIRLEPRIREMDGIPRGNELQAVLELAEQFPHRASRHLQLPRFPFDVNSEEGSDG